MVSRYTLFLLNFLLFANYSNAQSGNWESYIGEWEKGPGSVTFRMDLYKTSPQPPFPYLVATGLDYLPCREDGLPEKEAFEKLYRVADSVEALMNRTVQNVFAGTFTYQCERLGYFYVADTIGIRSKLRQLYRMEFNSEYFHINIKEDEKWDTYRKFLYPNEITMEYIQNEKVTSKLLEAGDDLSKSRLVDHWLYFKTETDRDRFEEAIKKEGYKTDQSSPAKDKRYPIRISRKDMVDVASISQQTLALKKMASKYRGEYDGWETFAKK